ncbi:MAG: type 4a pilus biogenesis protein PilO [Acidimicrobiia bacterium]|nr:MAG: type 4a pilus biogenesis protein PilO [Acidimicrobiia bacterium]
MKRNLLLAVLGVLLITVLWWMFLISPRNGEIADLERETFAAVDTEQRLRVQIVQLEEISESEDEYVEALDSLAALIPTEPELDEFIEDIDALAQATSVDLLTLAPSTPAAPVSETSTLRDILVSCEIEGEFFEILGFLFGLTDMERLVRVDAVSLSSSESETGAIIISAGLELRLFTLSGLIPAEGAEGAASAPEPDDGGGDTP